MTLKSLLIFLPYVPRQEERFISYYLHLTIASSFKYLKEQDYVKHPTLPKLGFFIYLSW